MTVVLFPFSFHSLQVLILAYLSIAVKDAVAVCCPGWWFLCCAETLILCSSICWFLELVLSLLQIYSKSSHLNIYLEMYTVYFPLIISVFWGFKLRCLIHFLLIFIQDKQNGSEDSTGRRPIWPLSFFWIRCLFFNCIFWMSSLVSMFCSIGLCA